MAYHANGYHADKLVMNGIGMVGKSGSRLGLAAALAVAAMATPGYGLGLGNIEVHSALNQPLEAAFALYGVPEGERGAVAVAIAGPAAYARFGVKRGPVLDDLILEIVPSGDPSRLRVLLLSRRSIREPLLTVLVQARVGRRRVLREYTILLDPPGLSAPVVAADSNPPPLRRTLDSAPAAGAAPASVGERDSRYQRYGPVAANQTLWAIAKEVRTDPAIHMNQMLLALYQTNPQAFDGNMNRLLRGAFLLVPEAAAIRAIDPGAAAQAVARQHQAFVGGASPPTQPAPVRPAGELHLEAPPDPAALAAAGPAVSASPGPAAMPILATLAGARTADTAAGEPESAVAAAIGAAPGAGIGRQAAPGPSGLQGAPGSSAGAQAQPNAGAAASGKPAPANADRAAAPGPTGNGDRQTPVAAAAQTPAAQGAPTPAPATSPPLGGLESGETSIAQAATADPAGGAEAVPVADTPVQSVVPESVAWPGSDLLWLLLAAVLLVFLLVWWLRRRQYKPVPADFSLLEPETPPAAAQSTSPEAADEMQSAVTPKAGPREPQEQTAPTPGAATADELESMFAAFALSASAQGADSEDQTGVPEPATGLVVTNDPEDAARRPGAPRPGDAGPNLEAFDLGGFGLVEPAADEPSDAPHALSPLQLGEEGIAREPEAEAAEGQGAHVAWTVADPPEEPEPAPAVEAPAADPEEAAIKLDLARAYLDMEEPGLALSLLEDVQAQGDESQRQEAERLIARSQPGFGARTPAARIP